MIDIQNEYFPGRRMELFAPLEAAAKASVLLEHLRELDVSRLVAGRHAHAAEGG